MTVRLERPQDRLLEDNLRANVYGLLANLLAAPPDAELLARLRAINPPAEHQTVMASAWTALQQAAQTVQADAIDDEYHALFIGLGRGELVPYGSWYRTGFLMEKPLGELRRDLAALGYVRPEHTHEPEDHVAALCEVMALISRDQTVSFDRQRAFFEAHLSPWMEAFFADLQHANHAHFYRAVGRLGGAFMALETHYLTLLV